MKKILIIDDEEKLRNLTARIIRLEGFEVEEAADCKSGLKKVEKGEFDVVLCDVRLPDGNGVDLVPEIIARSPGTEVILITAYGNIPDGVQAIKNGAFNYIVKGDENNKIIPLIHNAIEKSHLTKKVARLEARLDTTFSFGKIIGVSAEIAEASDLAKKASSSDITVLLTGETGTGKEVFANAIHQNSNRKSENFLAINCSAISHDLLESELFGHKEGAFTGALRNKKGLLLEADKGTVFLDEIGEMPLDLQAKLLRVLETGEFLPVGDTKPQKTNIRIIAATNRNLKEEIERGKFRMDLYYRLSVFKIHLPPLRDRVSDIELLANHFLQQFAEKNNKAIKPMAGKIIQLLRYYDWPGNIRELRNVIERSVTLENTCELQIDNLPSEIKEQLEPGNNTNVLSAFSLASAEKLHIQKVLNYTNGNKSDAAKLLKIGIATLYRKVDEYKLQ
ncbi:sigma-54-dependent transcriptional regulator [Flavobacterium psychrotrophum]|uniref:sigma-54-dependent transcriptional regulator n=1 Tax=Flavobacterium psychrotrophum TaxID=2294119 RepID=UPI000E31A193|nr:sigma-54 dependent transcriptional regulator [Flavobacterium psychrotrophum]